MSDILSKCDYDILLLHILKDPKTFLNFVEKTDEPVFDPVKYTAHDFIAKVIRDIYYQHNEFMAVGSLKYKVYERLEESGFDDTIKNLVKQTFEYASKIDTEELSPSIANNILEKVINNQIARDTTKKLEMVLERGTTTGSILKEMSSEIDSRRLGMSDQMSIMNPLENMGEYMTHSEVFPTGVEFVDTMLRGGPWRHDLLGLLAPSGGGKTTFAIQVLISWIRQHPDRHSVLLSYEQPLEGDISSRLCSAVTGLSTELFRGKTMEELKDGVREKYTKSIEGIKGRFHMADMSKGIAGTKGLEDIQYILDQFNLPEEGPPTLVVIDWLLPLVQRAMVGEGVTSLTNESFRLYSTQFMDALKVMKNNRNIIIIVNHQLTADKAGASSNRKPNWTDAAEWKGFAWYMDVCFAIGVLSEEQIAWFCASKVRATASSDILVKLRGDYIKFVKADNDFMLTNGKIVPKVKTMDNRDNSGNRSKADVGHLKGLDSESATAQFGE